MGDLTLDDPNPILDSSITVLVAANDPDVHEVDMGLWSYMHSKLIVENDGFDLPVDARFKDFVGEEEKKWKRYLEG